eukprot:TRINITY_DN29029_c0_g1_i1.p1 TRINITY_DN29029_c0_g1~~TRINITY_DN29029_c0_g1_i1.p1  ORF type:complete len:1265 (-),score=190.91 TRINITY_DN29029_c0_g1_i1:11-3805(-)
MAFLHSTNHRASSMSVVPLSYSFGPTRIVFGRDPLLAHVVLTSSEPALFSRTHAIVSSAPGNADSSTTQYYITDLKSVNGTFVNRRRIAPYTPHPLRPDDYVMFGAGGDIPVGELVPPRGAARGAAVFYFREDRREPLQLTNTSQSDTPVPHYPGTANQGNAPALERPPSRTGSTPLVPSPATALRSSEYASTHRESSPAIVAPAGFFGRPSTPPVRPVPAAEDLESPVALPAPRTSGSPPPARGVMRSIAGPGSSQRRRESSGLAAAAARVLVSEGSEMRDTPFNISPTAFDERESGSGAIEVRESEDFAELRAVEPSAKRRTMEKPRTTVLSVQPKPHKPPQCGEKPSQPPSLSHRISASTGTTSPVVVESGSEDGSDCEASSAPSQDLGSRPSSRAHGQVPKKTCTRKASSAATRMAAVWNDELQTQRHFEDDPEELLPTQGPVKRNSTRRQRSPNCSETESDVDHPTESNSEKKRAINPKPIDGKPLRLIPRKLFDLLKPHQVDGVRFMWRTVVMPKESNRGCILAHSMGLGKTLQVVVTTYMFFKHLVGRRAMVVAPKSTLTNWHREFKEWPRKAELSPIVTILLGDQCPTVSDRLRLLRRWANLDVAVLLIGFEMFTRLIGQKTRKRKRGQPDTEQKEVLSPETREFRELLTTKADLVVIDEAHKISNKDNAVTLALSRIKTRRRIALTGTPLQNNLLEYWAMIDFVRPGKWTRDAFRHFFVSPITAGQNRDSSPSEIQLMKKRSYALTRQLRPIVHRREVNILQRCLPPIREFAVYVDLSEFQKGIYASYLEWAKENDKNSVLELSAVLRKICDHTDLVRKFCEEEDKEGNVRGPLPFAKPVFAADYAPGGLQPERGTKMSVLLRLIDAAVEKGEKLLVFSQHVKTLEVIESLLIQKRIPVPGGPVWAADQTFYRLDGATPLGKRQEMMNEFNRPGSPPLLFLISVKAGGLGINLCAATRVILFDVSWNPAYDQQAIFRAYRYGQTKPVFVYRLVVRGCVEENIWKRCQVKTWLFKRVVEDDSPERTLRREELDLFTWDGEQQQSTPAKNTPIPDPILETLAKEEDSISAVVPVECLFRTDEDDQITEEEKRASNQEYQQFRDRGWAEPTTVALPQRPVISPVPQLQLQQLQQLQQQQQQEQTMAAFQAAFRLQMMQRHLQIQQAMAMGNRLAGGQLLPPQVERQPVTTHKYPVKNARKAAAPLPLQPQPVAVPQWPLVPQLRPAGPADAVGSTWPVLPREYAPITARRDVTRGPPG